MILTLLVGGVALAWLIARFNKSNKLFWILFTSFVVGIAGGFLLHKKANANKEKAVLVCPTHECIAAQNAYVPVTCTALYTPVSFEQNRASQNNCTIFSSDRCSEEEDDDLTLSTLLKPPRIFDFFNTS